MGHSPQNASKSPFLSETWILQQLWRLLASAKQDWLVGNLPKEGKWVDIARRAKKPYLVGATSLKMSHFWVLPLFHEMRHLVASTKHLSSTSNISLNSPKVVSLKRWAQIFKRANTPYGMEGYGGGLEHVGVFFFLLDLHAL